MFTIPDLYFKKVIKLLKCRCLKKKKNEFKISQNEIEDSKIPAKEEEHFENSSEKVIKDSKIIQDQVT